MNEKKLRIVVASPSDVLIERDILEDIAEELNRGIAAVLGLRLEIIRWETNSFPGFHTKGPQGIIDAVLRIGDCDLLVGIFWKRFGTPVTDADSGTEHEFKIAYDSWKRTGRPQIMVYFNQKPYMPFSKAETDQQGKVLEFRNSFPEEGMWWLYNGKFQFEKAIRNHLTQFIMQRATLESTEVKLGSLEPETLVEFGLTGKSRRPGGELAKRPLHFIWMIDCSGSMGGSKIQALNTSMREMIPHIQKAAQDNPNAKILMRVISFSDGARWHVAEPSPIEDFHWQDLSTGGSTDAGAALTLVADQLKIPPMSERALPPVLILVLDGSPTDNFDEGLRKLNEQVWGRKSIRIGIAIGRGADRNILQSFMGTDAREPIEMHNAPQLLEYIKWASTSIAGSSSKPSNIVQDFGIHENDVW
jgi:uncharacterized protein YegL